MENHSPHQGIPATMLSILSATIAWIQINQAQTIISLFASVVALMSGVMAIRYYYYATKKIKQ